jgi:hypothetical protein
MTLYEYKMLSKDDQWDTVFSKIDKFFVEVEWNIETDEIIGKGEFKYGHTLDKYSNVPKEI